MLRQFKKALRGNARAGIALDGSCAGLARVRRLANGRLSLAARALETDEGREAWPDRAASHAAGMGLQGTPVSAVLPADAYQLQLVEMPNVPEDERLQAVRWRLKELIDYPIDEAVVELLEMPRHANPGNAPIAYAVVTRNAEVLHQIEVMKRADLQMDVIDIPELCIRNIATLLPQDANGVAFLHLAEDCGYLTITRNGVLHMTRRLETGRRALADASADEFALQERMAGISLEVQRSLDYYESHYDRRPVTEIILGPGTELDALPAALTEHLGLTANRIDLADLFSMEDELSADDQGSCLLAIGAALRSDQATRATA
ncbi:MAG: pilus assembly protein PilM [Gammaproteobacteria bacterium]|nr:pilus assembly protein PilM [Gammaproteobacteria bacterium]